MSMNRDLFLALVVYFLIMLAVNIGDRFQTGTYREEFSEAHKRLASVGKMEKLRVLQMTNEYRNAKVFFVESVYEPKTRSTFEVGRLVEFELDNNHKVWHETKRELYWDDRKNSGNKFTFPPYIGSDPAILLKV